MANVVQFKKLVENNSKTYEVDVFSKDDFQKFLSKNGMKTVESSNTVEHSPIYKKITGSTSSSGESSTSESILGNVKINATNQNDSVHVVAKVGRVLKGSNEVKCGAYFMKAPRVIAAVAEACGYSIGWEIAEQIFIDKQNTIHWGQSVVSNDDGMKYVYCVGCIDDNDIISHIDYELICEIIKALKDWGLWNSHPAIQPIEPVFHQYVDYNFTNRFPPIPTKYIKQFQEIIDFVWPESFFQDKYMLCTICSDGRIVLNVIWSEESKLCFWTRDDSVINNNKKIVANQIILSGIEKGVDGHRTFLKRFIRYPNGDIEQTEESELTGTPWQLTMPENTGIDAYLAYDSFGTDYRKLYHDTFLIEYNFRIGELIQNLSDVAHDSNAVDIRNGKTDIENNLSSWLDDKIEVSTPDVRQFSNTTDYVAASPLNEKSDYLPCRIPGRDIDDAITQSRAISGVTPNSVLNLSFGETDSIIPFIGLDGDIISDWNPIITTPGQPTLPNGVGGIVNIYELNQTNLNAFTKWLWDPTVDIPGTFMKLFNNPYEAIIGLHICYANPAIIMSVNDIILGNLFAPNVSGNKIKQFNSVSCGYCLIKPHFNNVNDYINTQIQLYLPFIGFVPLDTSEVMGKYIFVDYNLDFLTGACTAFVAVKAKYNDPKSTFYQFSGNFAAEIPLTGTDYSNVLRNVIQAGVSGTLGTIAGGPAIGAITAGTTAALNSQVPVHRSGNLSANVGAMGIKSPYVIITRRPSYDAKNREIFDGLPQNANVRLSTCKGFTRVKNINLEGIACTEEEKSMILSKLQGGVII